MAEKGQPAKAGDAPTSAAETRLAELLRMQRAAAEGEQNKQSHPSLERALFDASGALRSALFYAGVCERRALLTERPEDGDAYAAALVSVDAAYAELWAIEAFGARVRIDDVGAERDALIEEVREATATLDAQAEAGHPEPGAAAAAAARLEAGRRIATCVPLPEAALQVAGIVLPPASSASAGKRDVTTGGGAASRRAAAAAADLRRRLSTLFTAGGPQAGRLRSLLAISSGRGQ